MAVVSTITVVTEGKVPATGLIILPKFAVLCTGVECINFCLFRQVSF